MCFNRTKILSLSCLDFDILFTFLENIYYFKLKVCAIKKVDDYRKPVFSYSIVQIFNPNKRSNTIFNFFREGFFKFIEKSIIWFRIIKITRELIFFSHRHVSKMSTSSHWEVNNTKSSCKLAHGYRKGDERLSLSEIGAE